MPNNYLLTGRPGIGKTTIIYKVNQLLMQKGVEGGGIYCPEIREDGKRKGFYIIDLRSNTRRILAHVDEPQGPAVGPYHINISNIDRICKKAFSRSLHNAEYILIDEIAPMEVHSTHFKREVRKVLNVTLPFLGVIHQQSKTGFIGEVKRRNDIYLIEVTKSNRQSLPHKLSTTLLKHIKPAERKAL